MNSSYKKLTKERQEKILKCGIDEFSSKTYTEASTDTIAQSSEISKGSLFHYFMSKKEFYLFCIEQSLERLVSFNQTDFNGDFYEVLFHSLEEKFALCLKYPNEVKLLNLVSKEMNKAVVDDKNQLLTSYYMKVHQASTNLLDKALNTLILKEGNQAKMHKALMLYIHAIIQQYLLEYRDHPLDFFQKRDEIKREVKEYICFMLQGMEKKS